LLIDIEVKNACLKTNEVSFQTGILLLKNVILGLDPSIFLLLAEWADTRVKPEYDGGELAMSA